MSRDTYTDRHSSNDDEDWEGDPYDDGDRWYDDGRDASRALMARDGSEFLPALEDDDLDPLEVGQHQQPLIIPGEGLPLRTAMRRRRRPLTMQILVASVAVCVLLSALFNFSPLTSLGGNNGIGGTFGALANAVVLAQNSKSFQYRARSGDTFDGIAARFGIQIGGIFEMNHLYAGDEATVGMVYLIPTDPNYGLLYVPPLPPGVSIYNSLPDQNRPTTLKCLFCSIAGKTNGSTGICPQSYLNNPNLLPQNYGLIQPETGDSPASHWVRGFTPYHSGVDMSTGAYGSPEKAIADGEVIFAAWDDGGGGYSVKINHCGGLASSYSHLEYIPSNMFVGAIVHQSEVIGYQGNTGNSFGTHLHFMLWYKNIPFDPLCAYGVLDRYSTSTPSYGGCPPNLIKGTAWYP